MRSIPDTIIVLLSTIPSTLAKLNPIGLNLCGLLVAKTPIFLPYNFGGNILVLSGLWCLRSLWNIKTSQIYSNSSNPSREESLISGIIVNLPLALVTNPLYLGVPNFYLKQESMYPIGLN
jgi:hypothetical protein